MSQIDPAAVIAAHRPIKSIGDPTCSAEMCGNWWPCEPFQLAEALIAERAKVTCDGKGSSQCPHDILDVSLNHREASCARCGATVPRECQPTAR